MFKILPAAPDQYRKVWDAGEEACQDKWEYTRSSEKDYQQYLASPDFCPELWMIAREGDEVAGMVLNFVREVENKACNRKRGYTERIVSAARGGEGGKQKLY